MAPGTTIRPLPADLQKIAIEQLNEVPERISADIEALRTWIEQQPHLKARTDEQFLVAFLRGCKYSLEKAKSKIDRFYTLRTKFPDVLGGRGFNLQRTLEVLRQGVILYLPTPLHDNGPRIGMLRTGAYDPSKYNFTEFMRLGQIFQEITLREDDYANICGFVSLCDFHNVGTSHFIQMTPSVAKKMTVWNEEAMPLRPKGYHFVNTPVGFEAIFNMVKPMLSKKQQNRMYVHGNKLESLHKQIPKKYLPKEYGGDNGTLQDIIDHWEQRIISYQDYFEEENEYGTDEALRPGKPINFESIFGMEGSFRKLDVD